MGIALFLVLMFNEVNNLHENVDFISYYSIFFILSPLGCYHFQLQSIDALNPGLGYS